MKELILNLSEENIEAINNHETVSFPQLDDLGIHLLIHKQDIGLDIKDNSEIIDRFKEVGKLFKEED